MKQTEFIEWLQGNNYDEGTIKSRVANCLRIEEFEGDLDCHYSRDKMDELLSCLKYSTENKRNNMPPKHSIPINGDIYNGTATFRSAINLYIKFLTGGMETGKGQDACKREITTHNHANEKNETLDSYERFLTTFGISKENLYKFGLVETILPEIDDIDKMWRDLKDRIYNNQTVFIRGAGRDAKGTQIYFDFYKDLFQNDSIEKDPTNNLHPQKIIQDLTGYRRNQNIYNYQVSHIFGRTKNPFLFEAPWNIAFVPKVIDPFTGHETKGIWPEEYQKLFLEKIRLRHKKYIQDYNAIIERLKIDEAINKFQLKNNKYESKVMEQFIKGIKVELSVI